MSKSKKRKQNKTRTYHKTRSQNGISLFAKICAFVLAVLTVLSIFSGFFF